MCDNKAGYFRIDQEEPRKTMKIKRIICALMAAMLLGILGFAAAAAEEDYDAVTYLDLGGQKLNYKTVKGMLAQYPNLQKVDMFDTTISPSQADELTAMYPNVEFGWTIKFCKDHVVRTDATAFSTLHFSGDPGHSTKDISVLRYCKKLKALDFGHNHVDDISWLTELPDLRFLIIAINRITDITPLASLTKLEYLEMFNNKITDLTPLKGLTHLMDLNLGYNNITDFSPLYEMPWLKRLWIGNGYSHKGDVPANIVEMLKEKLPDCEINSKSKPTLGGWREHPHHDVIKEMFDKKKGMKYIPFSDSFPDDED